ncbi:hypothetical protein [Nostoc sp.]
MALNQVLKVGKLPPQCTSLLPVCSIAQRTKVPSLAIATQR